MLAGMKPNPVSAGCFRVDERDIPAPSQEVIPQVNVTTVMELNGIKIAHTTGDSNPAAAMLTPATL